jgi:predicted RND superfamily exporter protein
LLSARFARFVVARRRLVLASIFVVTVVAALGLPHLRADFDPDAIVARAGDPPSESRDLLVLVEADDVTSAAALEYVRATSEHFSSQPDVSRVDSITHTPLPRFERLPDTLDDLEHEAPLEGGAVEAIVRALATDRERFPDGIETLADLHDGRRLIVEPIATDAIDDEAIRLAREQAAAPLVRGRLVDASRRAAIVRIETSAEDEAIVAAAEAWLADHPPPAGAAARLTGLPYVRIAMSRALEAEQKKLVLLAIIASFVVLFLGLRSLRKAMLPMATVGITLVIVVGALGLFGVSLSLLTSMVPPLLVTIVLAEAVHFVHGSSREVRPDGTSAADGTPASHRAETTLAKILPATSVASITTAIGFLSLGASDSTALREVCLVGTLAVLAALAITVTFLPAMLAGARTPERRPDKKVAVLRAVAMRASDRSALVIGAALVLGVAAGVTAWWSKSDGSLLTALDRDSELVTTAHRLERGLGGIRRIEVLVRGDRDELASARVLDEVDASVARVRSSSPDVLDAIAPTEPLHRAWGLLAGDDAAGAEPFTTDARVEALSDLTVANLEPIGASPLRVELRVADESTAAIDALVSRVAEAFAPLEREGLEVEVAGEATIASSRLEEIMGDLVGGLVFGLAAMFAVIALLLRSARLGLLAMPPNLLAIAVTLGYMTVRGIPLDPASAIVLPISLGLAVDGATHFLADFRRRTGTVRERVAKTAEHTGPAIVIGALTLLIGFAVLGISEFPPLRRFAELSTVSIGTSVIAVLTLLPALIVRFERERT